MAKILYTDGKQEEISPANGTYFQLKELYYYIECQTIEIFPIEGGRMLVCDGNSKARSDWQVNIKATELFRLGRMDVKQQAEHLAKLEKEWGKIIDAREDTLDCIAGIAILCQSKEIL